MLPVLLLILRCLSVSPRIRTCYCYCKHGLGLAIFSRKLSRLSLVDEDTINNASAAASGLLHRELIFCHHIPDSSSHHVPDSSSQTFQETSRSASKHLHFANDKILSNASILTIYRFYKGVQYTV